MFLYGRLGRAQQGVYLPSLLGGSSTQPSLLNSAILTNSKLNIFFAVFGGRDASELNGPRE